MFTRILFSAVLLLLSTDCLAQNHGANVGVWKDGLCTTFYSSGTTTASVQTAWKDGLSTVQHEYYASPAGGAPPPVVEPVRKKTQAIILGERDKWRQFLEDRVARTGIEEVVR
jgi:hypothetical protein